MDWGEINFGFLQSSIRCSSLLAAKLSGWSEWWCWWDRRAVNDNGTACLRLVDVEQDDVDVDDENDWDGLQCCFSLSLVRSRPLSTESGDDEFDRSLFCIAVNNGDDFVSHDGDNELLLEALCGGNKNAVAEFKFDTIDVVDGE